MKPKIYEIHIMKIYLELEQKVPNKIDDYYIDKTYYKASQIMDNNNIGVQMKTLEMKQ